MKRRYPALPIKIKTLLLLHGLEWDVHYPYGRNKKPKFRGSPPQFVGWEDIPWRADHNWTWLVKRNDKAQFTMERNAALEQWVEVVRNYEAW
jgi:hypothetical protein